VPLNEETWKNHLLNWGWSTLGLAMATCGSILFYVCLFGYLLLFITQWLTIEIDDKDLRKFVEKL
jgi:hypothetical protein